MASDISNNTITAAGLETVLIGGDLGQLSPADRVQYYGRVCESLGLNPLTKPFDYLKLNGKLTLYAKRDCADQLRHIHGVTVTIVDRQTIEGVYVVTARATDKGGRSDESTGAVAIKGLQGDALANALMKAETKSKRRVTLSLCGLGFLDESEIETIPNATHHAEPSKQIEAKPAPPPEKKLTADQEAAIADCKEALDSCTTPGDYAHLCAAIRENKDEETRKIQWGLTKAHAGRKGLVWDAEGKGFVPRPELQPA